MSSLWHQVAAAVVWAVALLIVVLTIVPMWRGNLWWVRALDFPRLQIALAGVVVFVAALFLTSGASRVGLVVMMIAAAGYQAWRIFPYTPFARVDMKLAADGPDSVKILSANVLMENEKHQAVLDVIGDFDPDILFLMETDQTWVDALAPALARYPTVLREPKDNHYGMVFATRLKTDAARIIQLTDSDTPSVFAQLESPDGTTFRYVGLHPRPPVPGISTKDRDAQIHYAARFAASSGIPLIATGDFNDVAWSDTSQMFKRVGHYLDVRIGRGFFASFDATKWYLRFPIDQFYTTRDIAVVSIKRYPYVGSDHFPIAAVVRLDSDLAATLNVVPKPLSDSEEDAVTQSVERMRQRLRHGPLVQDGE